MVAVVASDWQRNREDAGFCHSFASIPLPAPEGFRGDRPQPVQAVIAVGRALRAFALITSIRSPCRRVALMVEAIRPNEAWTVFCPRKSSHVPF
jgi:hypothetical protein